LVAIDKFLSEFTVPALPASAGSALIEAASSNNADRVQVLCRGGAPLESQTVSGWTAAAMAIEKGAAAAAAALFAFGASTAWRSSHGRSMLHVAAFRGHLGCIRLCIEHGIPVDLLCGDQTPLMAAVTAGNTEAVRLLLLLGARSSLPALADRGTFVPCSYLTLSCH
jgi:ankyrin repeat protein